ncbi:phytanoyl-CoA dioxygenase family protein [Desertihabitans brevis]|uniref:Phytanoyl-CoA dioxygenase family protein n=1 Tax=Desertihabitans brevis TaxID=2268447 RepID=A0A367YXN3_9ACTN|nr:phytanoyl-CoA dioxygenase family protein [Desertihabitans brevis]RCK70665.1 phytanoyl-CoA dioxygenase family protein [Desertihabitans brevis]
MTTATAPAATSGALRRFDTAGEDFVHHFDQHGFGVVAGALTPAQVEALTAEAVELCAGERGQIAGSDPRRPGESDEDLLRRFLCIHHPHKVSDVAMDALTEPRIVDFLTAVIGPNVKAMQSMLFIKSEGKPGQAWHQDEFFIPTRDRSLTAVWIALDDATVENGCLWVLPGSHRRGVIYPDREHDDPDFDCSVELYDFPYEESDAVPVELVAGEAVVFNGYLLHRSLRNSGRHGYRRALTNHYMSAESLLPWQAPPQGVHIAKHDWRDIVLVAGEDPYAWKGTVDLTRPHTRPDRDGGCDR